MAIKTILNPLLEEGFQKINDVSNAAFVQEDTLTNAGTVTLSGSKTTVSKQVLSFITRVTAIDTSSGDVWSHQFKGAIYNASGTAVLIDTIVDEYIAESAGAAGYTVTITAGATTLDINVTSGVATQVKWKAETVFSEITF